MVIGIGHHFLGVTIVPNAPLLLVHLCLSICSLKITSTFFRPLVCTLNEHFLRHKVQNLSFRVTWIHCSISILKCTYTSFLNGFEYNFLCLFSGAAISKMEENKILTHF